jgi:hypothetical protein
MLEVEDRLSRRALLRRAAVIAGLVGTPAFVEGCAPPPPPPPPPVLAPPEPPIAQPAPPTPGPYLKQSKAEAAYRDYPNGPQRCGACVHFRPPNDCEVIQGPVQANGWCRNFRPRV